MPDRKHLLDVRPPDNWASMSQAEKLAWAQSVVEEAAKKVE